VVSKTSTNKGFGFVQNGYVFILFERKFILRFINTNPQFLKSQMESFSGRKTIRWTRAMKYVVFSAKGCRRSLIHHNFESLTYR